MPLDLRPTPIVKKLMVGLFSIWLFFSFLINFAEQSWAHDLYVALSLDPSEALFGFQFWQLLTYSALHDITSPSHIIFNLMGLFFLGPALEQRWGGRDFFRFVVSSALIAGLFSTFVGLMLPDLFGAKVVGVSGAIMAILAAFSFVLPNATILLFFVIPVQARWIVWIAVGIDVIFFLSGPQSSDLAIHTHLGGVLAAWLLITGNWRPSLFKDRLRLFTLKQRRRPTLKIIKGGRDDDQMLN